MKIYFKIPNFKNKRKALAIAFFVIFYVVALLVSMNFAERNGVYWLNPSYTVNATNNRISSFYTVDISQTDELTTSNDSKDIENNINTGEIHHIPNMTEFELFLYDALAKNGGYLTEEDLQKLKTLHTKIVSQPNKPVDEFYDFLFQNRDENYLTKKMLSSSTGYSADETVDEKRPKFVRKLTYSTHKVKEGQTLWNIARDYGVSVKTILASNQDTLSKDGSNLRAGSTIRIPNTAGIFIKVTKGDTISEIAAKYNIPTKNILIANNKTSSKVQIGERLFLPGAKELHLAREKQIEVEVTTRRGKKIQKYVARTKGEATRRKGRLAWPLRSRIALSSSFGVRRSPFRRRRTTFHAGIDLSAPRGISIHAAAPGRVTFSGWRSGYGKTIEITHSNGVKTIYAHCSRLLAHTGQSVGIGQAIGTVGSTGRSTGNHLHFEVRVNGIPRNPFSYLK